MSVNICGGYYCFNLFSPSSTVGSTASATAEKERLKKAERFKENYAAKNIQREWRGYKQRKDDEEVGLVFMTYMRYFYYDTLRIFISLIC